MDNSKAFSLLEVAVLHVLEDPDWCAHIERELDYVPVLTDGDVVGILTGSPDLSINPAEIIAVLKIVCEVTGIACPIIQGL